MSSKSADKNKYLQSISGREFISLHPEDVDRLAERIAELRIQGKSYSTIAKEVNMSVTLTRDFFSIKRPFFYAFKLCFAPYPIVTIQDKIETICSMFVDNYLYSEIAEKVGLPVSGIRNFISDQDMERKMDADKVRTQLDELWSVWDIADYYGVTAPMVYKFLSENGIKTLSAAEKRMKKPSKTRPREYDMGALERMTASELNPQYSEDRDEFFTLGDVIKNYADVFEIINGRLYQEENRRELFAIGRLPEELFREYARYRIDDIQQEKETGLAEYFLRLRDGYAACQYGHGTIDNFMYNTMCAFSGVAIPSRKPDLCVSYNGVTDKYYFYKDHLIRGSRYWGFGIGSNDWMLVERDGKMCAGMSIDAMSKYHCMKYGRADYTNFVYKTNIQDGRLLSFENTAFGGIVLYDNKLHFGEGLVPVISSTRALCFGNAID